MTYQIGNPSTLHAQQHLVTLSAPEKPFPFLLFVNNPERPENISVCFSSGVFRTSGVLLLDNFPTSLT